LFLVGLAPGQQFPSDDVQQLGFQVCPRGPLWEIELNDGQSIDAVVELLRSRNLSLRHLMEKRQSLEELFLKVVTDERGSGDSPAEVGGQANPPNQEGGATR
jgi:ABC-2 type transport system ATP-binding protein